ncbi:MAG TPA: hypothetical protein VLA93_22125 [Pyrinomonadaceae bacterium]|nr:hypothetical protein [Pyrinomonadaceae bacterium]
MNCICDEFRFPPETIIRAGLTEIPRQTGTFAEFRRALLRAISIRTTASLENHPLWSLRYLIERDRDGLRETLASIGNWRGRHPEDFGMMLLEMWAYVCDLTSFYDDVLAHESYVRTARRRESLRKLVAPLGYIPRPAVSALAELAAFADGRQVVTLPVGTAFRSGAFDGNPPQVFELDVQTTIHPLLNEWSFLPIRPNTFGNIAFNLSTLLCEIGTVSVEEGDLVLVKVGTESHARMIASVADVQGADRLPYTAVTLSTWVPISAHQEVHDVKLLRPASTSSLWTLTTGGFGELSHGPMLLPYGSFFLLDSITPSFHIGQDLIVEGGGSFNETAITKVEIEPVELQAASTTIIRGPGTPGPVIAQVPVPAVTANTTRIEVEPAVPFTSHFSWLLVDPTDVTIHHTFVSGGKVTIEALTEIDQGDVLKVETPIESPRDAAPPGEFELEDFNGLGLLRPGILNFATGSFSVQGDPWPLSLATPVRLFGNIIHTSRGETVNGEVLGTGDGSIANQSFTLKKSPVTYLPWPSDSTPSGLTSSLKVYVDGLQWTEVKSFYGQKDDAQIYVVRQNDKNESVVTFGDGIHGKRLNTGSSLVAYYRHGGGSKMPPTDSITQLAKPVKGLKSVRSPVPPYGGADEEPADSLQKFAPRSALLLGRAVSLADLEAATASYAGVRAVATEWRWSSELQVPAAHVWYLADGDLTELILGYLRGLTQPNTPIQVERAVASVATLSVQLTHDPKRFEDEVLSNARTALMDVETGLLPPERLGIGKPLFRSRLFEFLLTLTGVVSVTGLTFNSTPFSNFGVKPPAGHYFDFTNTLLLNGRTE